MTMHSRLTTSGRPKKSAPYEKSPIFQQGQHTKDFSQRALGRKRLSSLTLTYSHLRTSERLRQSVEATKVNGTTNRQQPNDFVQSRLGRTQPSSYSPNPNVSWDTSLLKRPSPLVPGTLSVERLHATSLQRSYAILGTGALGGFYGARLQRAGLEVHFLLHRDYEHVSKYGLRIESSEGNFTLPCVRAYRHFGDMPPCDVVVVTLKTTQNSLLHQMLPPLLKDDGVVLVLQNGLGVEEEIAQIVGSDRVMGGLCFTFNYKLGPGHIHHLDYGLITLAEYAPDYIACGITERMKQVASDFERAGILMQLAEDLLLARWQKLVCNIPFNGLSVVFNATTEELMADIHSRDLVEQLMQEVANVAAAYGRAIPNEYIQKRLNYIAKMGPYRTSMKIDYDAGRPLEVEALFGYPLRAATKAGISTPYLGILYRELKFFDAHNNRKFQQILTLSK